MRCTCLLLTQSGHSNSAVLFQSGLNVMYPNCHRPLKFTATLHGPSSANKPIGYFSCLYRGLSMHRLSIAVIAASTMAFAQIAAAADMPAKAPHYAPGPAPIFSWSGCYVGANAGWMGNNSTLNSRPSGQFLLQSPAINALATTSYDLKESAFIGGVVYGCQSQFGQVVLGLDSDFDWTGIDKSITTFYPPAPPWLAHTDTVTHKLRWLSTTRARIGWAQDRWMIFAAGGLATGRVSSSSSAQSIEGIFYGSRSTTRWGWTIGGGIEYALTQNWFLRGEYMYVDLGSFDYTDYTQNPSPFTFDTEVKTREHVVRAALTYRFTTNPSLLHWAMNGFKY